MRGTRAWLRLLCLLGLFLAGPVLAQSIMERLITPGPLSSAHARLEGNCTACHSSFRKEAQNSQCVACHKDVGGDVAAGKGYHGKFAPARSGTCRSCHNDHKGRGFAVVQLDSRHFNHALTDFALTGSHGQVPCAKCHADGARKHAAPKTCAGCHGFADPHKGQLGRECQTCHATTAWKTVQPFDHSRTGFALTGGHRSVQCAGCHAGQRWKGLASTCVSCHAKTDVHKGANGTNCAQCHTTASWKSATFDHATTRFPLLGAHAAATCASCHGAGQTNRRPAHQCTDCHARQDVHKGGNGTDCAACHTSRTWKQIVFDHDRQTDFALHGAHRQAACAACHVQPARAVKVPADCNGCHAKDDRHKGGNGPKCQSCHDETSWKLSRFNHDTMTTFPLLGGHAGVKCASCHVKPAGEVRLSDSCAACHAATDPHKGHLGQACADCHVVAAWKAPIRFDHALSRFPLLGKHAALQCAACHADRTYTAKGTACAACHADTHHKGTLGTPSACETCHNARDWKAWTFDHDHQTRFGLVGGHQGLICAACHTRPADPARLPARCIDCHERDDKHRGGFGDECQRCHDTVDFRRVRISMTTPKPR